MQWLKQNKRELIVLIIIIIICWLFHRFLYENGSRKMLPRLLGHFIIFLWFLILIILGYMGFLKNRDAWKKKFWVSIHLIVLLLLIYRGIIEKIEGNFFSLQWRDLFSVAFIFFTSPMPFLIIWLLPSILKLNGSTNSNSIS